MADELQGLFLHHSPRDTVDMRLNKLNDNLLLIYKILFKMADQNAQIQQLLQQAAASLQIIVQVEQDEDTNLQNLITLAEQIKKDEETGADQTTTVKALQSLVDGLTGVTNTAKGQTAKIQDAVTALNAAPPPPVATTHDVEYTEADGSTKLTISQAGDKPAAGDAVKDASGNPVADGSYTLSDGSVLAIAGGVVVTFTAAG